MPRVAGFVPRGRGYGVSGARKKVIVRRFVPGLLRGYMAPSGFVEGQGDAAALELLDLAGRVQLVPLQEVKTVSFVREFNLNDEGNPERLPRKTFVARPRTEGLWVRMTLRDDEQMEGLAPLDLALADGLVSDLGIHVTPPDVRGNTQRVYVPRSAMTALQVVAVVTTPSRRRALEQIEAVTVEDAQFSLALPQEPA